MVEAPERLCQVIFVSDIRDARDDAYVVFLTRKARPVRRFFVSRFS